MKKTEKSQVPRNHTQNALVLILLLAGLVLLFIYAGNKMFFMRRWQHSQPLPPYQNQRMETNLPSVALPSGKPLPPQVKDALEEALNDEYKAQATYDAVIAKYGEVRPFTQIVRAEKQHIAMLENLFQKYSLLLPPNTWSTRVVAPASLQEACKTGVAAETANAALYTNTLLPSVTNYPDITAVFEALRDASAQNHLPAFERCN